MLFSRQTTPPIIPPCNILIQVKVTIWIGKLLRTLLKGNTFIDSPLKTVFYYFSSSFFFVDKKDPPLYP
jgi:hypothetical protein